MEKDKEKVEEASLSLKEKYLENISKFQKEKDEISEQLVSKEREKNNALIEKDKEINGLQNELKKKKDSGVLFLSRFKNTKEVLKKLEEELAKTKNEMLEKELKLEEEKSKNYEENNKNYEKMMSELELLQGKLEEEKSKNFEKKMTDLSSDKSTKDKDIKMLGYLRRLRDLLEKNSSDCEEMAKSETYQEEINEYEELADEYKKEMNELQTFIEQSTRT